MRNIGKSTLTMISAGVSNNYPDHRKENPKTGLPEDALSAAVQAVVAFAVTAFLKWLFPEKKDEKNNSRDRSPSFISSF